MRAGPRSGILELFDGLPGDLGLKIHVPSKQGCPGFSVQMNPDKVLFAASAIKAFALCQALRKAERTLLTAMSTKHSRQRRCISMQVFGRGQSHLQSA